MLAGEIVHYRRCTVGNNRTSIRNSDYTAGVDAHMQLISTGFPPVIVRKALQCHCLNTTAKACVYTTWSHEVLALRRV
jgi:hypothetical protein